MCQGMVTLCGNCETKAGPNIDLFEPCRVAKGQRGKLRGLIILTPWEKIGCPYLPSKYDSIVLRWKGYS